MCCKKKIFSYFCGHNPTPIGGYNLSDASRLAKEVISGWLLCINTHNMTTKVNILIDGGFFERKFLEANNRNATAADVVAIVNDAMNKVITKTNGDTKDILFRVFYYDCKPFGETVPDHTKKSIIDFSSLSKYKKKCKFLSDLAKQDKFAVRLGELSFDGWKQDLHNPQKYKPDFKQKGVDMKVGLDMASMATKHIVDKIVLIAGDSDFISPIKFVRKEGLQVYLYSMGHKVKKPLIEHCDFVLN